MKAAIFKGKGAIELGEDGVEPFHHHGCQVRQAGRAFADKESAIGRKAAGFLAIGEIDDGIAGTNYGWPTCEGACSPPNSNFRDPIYQYSHAEGCAKAGAGQRISSAPLTASAMPAVTSASLTS